MLLYHGSPVKLEKLEKRQAGSPDAKVPAGELLKAIYFTPDYGFAVACAVRPEGTTTIDGKNKTIKFEHPELFDPEKQIFIYIIDSEKILPENIHKIDNHQYAVDAEELEPDSVDQKKAREVLKYYKLVNWEQKESRFKVK